MHSVSQHKNMTLCEIKKSQPKQKGRKYFLIQYLIRLGNTQIAADTRNSISVKCIRFYRNYQLCLGIIISTNGKNRKKEITQPLSPFRPKHIYKRFAKRAERQGMCPSATQNPLSLSLSF